MTAPRSVIVSIQSAIAPHSAIEVGIEFAALFRTPVRGLYVENATLPSLCDLPAAFLPVGIGRAPGQRVRQAMASALLRETRRVREDLERYAARARVELTLTVQRGVLSESLAKTTAPGDIVVVPVDLSEPQLSSAIGAAARLCPESGGVLVVPERRPSRSGAVVAVVGGSEDRSVAIAAKVAAGIGVPLLILIPEAAEPRRSDIRDQLTPQLIEPELLHFRTLKDRQRVDSTTIKSSSVRLIVCETSNLDRMSLDGAEAPMRHFRAPLLLLASE